MKTALYRHFNAEGRLLYVGISLNAVNRLEQHRSGSRWYSEISRVELQWLEDRESALAAEAMAIAQEDPLWNIVRPVVEESIEFQPVADPWETNEVLVRGEELDPVLWQGWQWAVTTYGIERRDGCYTIEADRLTEGDSREHDWTAHMAEKNWVNMPDFVRAMTIALRVHMGIVRRPQSFIVAHVPTGAYDGFYKRREDPEELCAEFSKAFPGERFIVVDILEHMRMRQWNDEKWMRFDGAFLSAAVE